MGIYVKKTITGYKMLSEANRSDATHYLVTVDEYDDIRQQLTQSASAVTNMREEVSREVKAAYDDANARLKESLSDFKQRSEYQKRKLTSDIASRDDRIRELKDLIEKADKDLQAERDLQKNLLRIAKERANQKRDIRPKKQHDGYIVLETGQWLEKYLCLVWADGIDPADYKEPEDFQYAKDHSLFRQLPKETIVWRSVLQTPYEATLPIEEVGPRIEQELRENVLQDLGCASMVASEKNGEWPDEEATTNETMECILYRWRYRASYQRAGLWEVEVHTTRPLIIPVHRRPSAK